MSRVLPPTLLLAFNRPEFTQRVVERLLSIGSGVLYAHVDGPRPGVETDPSAIDLVIEQLTRLDSDYDLSIRLSERNLGCAWGPVHGINWFFGSEHSGVVLEDDLLPSPDFFSGMRLGLACYEDDESIYSIQGYSHLPSAYSARFRLSRFSGSWGWASWASRWKQFEGSPSYWLRHFPLGYALRHFGPVTTLFWIRRLLMLVQSEHEGNLSVWDYQWLWTHWRDRALAAVVPVNLIENLGLDLTATHQTGYVPISPIGELEIHEWTTLELAQQVDGIGDDWHLEQVYRSSFRGMLRRLRH